MRAVLLSLDLSVASSNAEYFASLVESVKAKARHLILSKRAKLSYIETGVCETSADRFSGAVCDDVTKSVMNTVVSYFSDILRVTMIS